MNTKSKVVIVQPYVPTYRVAFFKKLRHRLADEGIECVVVAGNPEKNQKKRDDAVKEKWILPLDRRTVNIHGRSIAMTLDPALLRDADAVILGLEGTALPVYQSLLIRRRSGLRVGLWGHIRPYVTRGNGLDLWLEKQQMKNADHVFAYAPGGRSYAAKAGIHPDKITTVMNSVDTTTLAYELDSISAKELASFTNRHKVDPERALCFIGGLDASKRIRFLAEALDILWEHDPSIQILVGGRGPDADLLKRAYSRRQATPLGYLNIRDKAFALASTRGVCMPGRIGLVAVDALVAKRPVITTDWPFHAPEAEYLEEGESRITSPDSPQEYASLLQNFIGSAQPTGDYTYPTLDQMTENFGKGVTKLMMN